MGGDRRVIGFDNIELITDRQLRTNLDKIRRVKRAWPDRALVVSIMVPCEERSWRRVLPMVEDTGCDGLELQVCTTAMVCGFKIVQDMCSGLSNFMDEQGYTGVAQMVGRAVPSVTGWSNLNLNHVEKAVINQDNCIRCGRCHVACEDTSHRAISASKDGKRDHPPQPSDEPGLPGGQRSRDDAGLRPIMFHLSQRRSFS